MRCLLLLLFFNGLSMVVFGQTKTPVFQISSSPVTIDQPLIDSINMLLAPVSKKEIAFRIINHTLHSNRYRGILLKIRHCYPGNRSTKILRFYIGRPIESKEDELNRTVFRGDLENIYYTKDFQSYFGRQLFVFDTLRLAISLKDESYPINGYYLTTFSKDGSAAKIPLTVSEDRELIFYSKIIQSAFEPDLIKCNLYNASEHSPLAAFDLHFFNEKEKDLLRSQVKIYRKLNSKKEISFDKDLLVYMLGFTRDTFGQIKPSNLSAWLKTYQ